MIVQPQFVPNFTEWLVNAFLSQEPPYSENLDEQVRAWKDVRGFQEFDHLQVVRAYAEEIASVLGEAGNPLIPDRDLEHRLHGLYRNLAGALGAHFCK